MSKLHCAGLKINLDKCRCFQKEITFSGYKLDSKKVLLDVEQVKTIQEYNRPRNLKTWRGKGLSIIAIH